MDNGKTSSPRYYHVLIGTNNRYGAAHPINDKRADTILGSLKKFVDRYKPVKLTSDEDTALLSEPVLSYLKSKYILIQHYWSEP